MWLRLYVTVRQHSLIHKQQATNRAAILCEDHWGGRWGGEACGAWRAGCLPAATLPSLFWFDSSEANENRAHEVPGNRDRNAFLELSGAPQLQGTQEAHFCRHVHLATQGLDSFHRPVQCRICSEWLTVCGCHYLITVQLKIQISFVGVQTDVAFFLHVLITHSVVCNGIYNMKNTSLDFFVMSIDRKSGKSGLSVKIFLDRWTRSWNPDTVLPVWSVLTLQHFTVA